MKINLQAEKGGTTITMHDFEPNARFEDLGRIFVQSQNLPQRDHEGKDIYLEYELLVPPNIWKSVRPSSFLGDMGMADGSFVYINHVGYRIRNIRLNILHIKDASEGAFWHTSAPADSVLEGLIAETMKDYSPDVFGVISKKLKCPINPALQIRERDLEDGVLIVVENHILETLQEYIQWIDTIPNDILLKGGKYTHDYITSINKNIENPSLTDLVDLNASKVVVLGGRQVGKTALVGKLMGRTSAPSTPSDTLIVHDWPLEIGINQKVNLRIWDFSGREIIHPLHRIFLTDRSIYIIVVDASRGDAIERDLDHWLGLIQSVAAGLPVIVAVNTRDVKYSTYFKRGRLQDKYQQIQILGFVEANCMNGDGIKQLEAKIIAAIQDEATNTRIKDQVPAYYLKVKEDLIQSDSNYITPIQFLDKCRHHYPNCSEDEAQKMMSLLHDLGILLDFPIKTYTQTDIRVLKPAWITKGIYKVLDSRELIQSNGKIPKATLYKIIDSAGYKHHERDYILDQMVRFNICFDSDDDLFFPSAFPPDDPFGPGGYGNFLKEDMPTLTYHFEGSIPPHLMGSFIASYKDSIKPGYLWRHGCIIVDEELDQEAIVTSDLIEHKIKIYLMGKGDKHSLLNSTRKTFGNLCKKIPYLNVEEKIPIPNGRDVLYSDLVEYKNKNIDEYFCPVAKKVFSVKKLLGYLEEIPQKTTSIQLGDIEALIDKGQLEKAINLAQGIIDDSRLTRLKSRFSLVSKEYINGNITSNEKLTQEYKMTDSLLTIIEDYKT